MAGSGCAKRAGTPAPKGTTPFDEAFQRKLEYLAVVSRRLFAGRLRAERRTKNRAGHRVRRPPRVHPGDDLRALDWSVYARTERLLMKQLRGGGRPPHSHPPRLLALDGRGQSAEV
jgi:hypothetical protein